MQKLPFSPQGLQDLLTVLYALTDPQLELEAAALGTDLPTWINDKFDLNSHQVSFLNNLGAPFIAFSAARGSFALVNRLPIELVVPENYGLAAPLEKIIKSTDNTTIDSNNVPSGSLTFEVEFQ